jgi:hypothetical protein
LLGHPRLCGNCRAWEQKYHRTSAACLRCHHQARVNSDVICRPCLLAIRSEQDAEWVLHPEMARPRDRQLELLVGRQGAKAVPLTRDADRAGGRNWNQHQWKRVLERQRAAGGPDKTVLPPAVTGQAALFYMARVLSRDTMRQVRDRPLRGYDRAAAEAAVFAGEYGFTRSWIMMICELLRLALAVRDADGRDLVPEHALDDLPRSASAVAQVLDRAGMLGPREVPRSPLRPRPRKTRYLPDPPQVPSGPVSCPDCDCWHPGGRRLCRPCQGWRSDGFPAGPCARCRRRQLPLHGGLCRGCHWHIRVHGPAAASEPFTQLWISIPRDRDEPEPRFSPPGGQGCHLPAVPPIEMRGQQALFTAQRDWAPVLRLTRRAAAAALPAPTPAAGQLIREFARHQREQVRDPDYRKDSRTLTILVSWLGADNPIPEADVHDLARLDTNLAATRVCQFLRARGLLTDDPRLHQDPHLAWIDNALGDLPAQLELELRTWVTVLRGQGRRRHPARDYAMIRSYLARMLPVLHGWSASGTGSLREITPQHVTKAVTALRGGPRKSLAIALRSLFRALKQERIIFQDPTQQLVVHDARRLPESLPADVLSGLLQQATTAYGRLVIALAAIHALHGHEICGLLTPDVDLAAGRLLVRREHRPHALYLEELTHTLTGQWLAYRYNRWPASINPHLLVTQRTALDPASPPVSVGSLRLALPRGITLRQLRQDRILDEAAITADPLRLIRLFGITEATAMRYITAAHPERTTQIPR